MNLPMSARLANNLFFLCGGLGIGAWAASLPVLANQNALDEGQLGLVLLYFALGAILMMINVGCLTARYACSILSFFGALVFAISLMAVPHTSGPWLAAAVFFAGAGFGTLDVAMNTDASDLERRVEKHLMSSFHALFSIGNLVGAFLIGQILSRGGGLAICLGATGVGAACLATMAMLGAQNGRRAGQELHGQEGRRGKLEPAQYGHLIVLGAIAFFALLAEGGMMDWSAVYIVTEYRAAESIGAYGFAAFATMMALGRLVGDWITARIGSTRLLLASALTCAVSVAVLIVAQNLAIVFVALAACGLGVANIVPAVFAAAGRAGGPAAGHAMSIVTTMGYAGLLLGPALLGFVAQVSSLGASFGLVAGAFLLIAAGTRMIRAHR
jgi:MFS family permease